VLIFVTALDFLLICNLSGMEVQCLDKTGRAIGIPMAHHRQNGTGSRVHGSSFLRFFATLARVKFQRRLGAKADAAFVVREKAVVSAINPLLFAFEKNSGTSTQLGTSDAISSKHSYGSPADVTCPRKRLLGAPCLAILGNSSGYTED
jgi:hypothetical protein